MGPTALRVPAPLALLPTVVSGRARVLLGCKRLRGDNCAPMDERAQYYIMQNGHWQRSQTLGPGWDSPAQERHKLGRWPQGETPTL